MLRVSTSAVALLEENRRTQGVPPEHAIRIFGEGDGEGGIKVRMAFVEDPIATDHALTEHGMQFYVAPEVSEPLDGLVIDTAQDAPEQLVLRPEEG